MFSRKARTATQDRICVSERMRTRARQAISMGAPSVWIDQTLYLIGQNATHHKPGDPLLDEAIKSAEALLALLVEMKHQETS